MYISDFQSAEFQSLLKNDVKYCFYPEEFGIYWDGGETKEGVYPITKDELKDISSLFIAGVIKSRKEVICAKFIGDYAKFFNKLVNRETCPWGTLGEIAMLLNSN